MKKILLAFALLTLSTVDAATSSELAREPAPVDFLTGTVWMHLDGEWQHPPVDENTADYRAAPATLLRFTDNFQFSMIHCWISETNENIEISGGDGQVIYVGIWGPGDTGFNTYFRLVYEMIQPAGGGEYPGPEEKETAQLIGDAVSFRGKVFTAAKKLSFANYETFIDADGSRLKPTKYN